MSDAAWVGTLVPTPDFVSLRNPFPYSEILSETAQLLLQDVDPDTLCQAIFARLRTPFGVDVYFHYLLSDDESCLELASSGGSPKVRNLIGTKLDLGSAVCGTVARQRSAIYVTSVDRRQDNMTAFVRALA